VAATEVGEPEAEGDPEAVGAADPDVGEELAEAAADEDPVGAAEVADEEALFKESIIVWSMGALADLHNPTANWTVSVIRISMMKCKKRDRTLSKVTYCPGLPCHRPWQHTR
jgi:hypothetical protein